MLELDQAWAQDVCRRNWDTASCLSQLIHAAARVTACIPFYRDTTASESVRFYYPITISTHAADAAVQAANHSHHHDRYRSYVWAYSYRRVDQAVNAYATVAQRSMHTHGVCADDFHQAAADVVLGHAVGCISRGEDAVPRIKRSLHFAGSHEALNKILEHIEYLRRHCDTWKRRHHEEVKDSSPSSDTATGPQLLTAALHGAMVCSARMVLPMLWGAVVPWAWVLTGVCVGGMLISGTQRAAAHRQGGSSYLQYG